MEMTMAGRQFDNNMRGTLFKNDRKESANHPDYNGSCEIDGVEYWVNAWVKESKKDGKKFFSMSYKPKEERRGRGGTDFSKAPARGGGGQREPGRYEREVDDEIPF